MIGHSILTPSINGPLHTTEPKNVNSHVTNTILCIIVQVFPTLELLNEEKRSVMVQFKGSSNAPSFDFHCIRPAAGVSSLSVNTIIAVLCSPRLCLYACVSQERIIHHCPTSSDNFMIPNHYVVLKNK